MHCRNRSAPNSPATRKAFRQAAGNQPLLILAALLAVYIVLGVLYESLHPSDHDPLDAAAAGLGALLALLCDGVELSVIAFIGIILLIGIVKKNGIMLVDFALEAERSAGWAPRTRSSRPACERFRPILMTTMAADARRAAAGAGDRRRVRSCAVRSASRSSAGCSSRRS